MLFLLLNLGGVAIQCSSDLFLFAGQLLLSGAEYLKVFPADQLPALAMASLVLYKNGSMIAKIFYGAWLFPLVTWFSSRASCPGSGHCVDGALRFLADDGASVFPFSRVGAITYISWPLGFIAEFGLTLWLLIMGAKGQKPAANEAG